MKKKHDIKTIVGIIIDLVVGLGPAVAIFFYLITRINVTNDEAWLTTIFVTALVGVAGMTLAGWIDYYFFD